MGRKRLEDRIGETINGRTVVGVHTSPSGSRCIVVECRNGHRAKTPTNKARVTVCGVCESRRNTRHGHNRRKGTGQTAEYRSWSGMKRRCTNPRGNSYQRYGARGVKVCERWRGDNGYANFYEDMGPRPTPQHSIDRIDNDGDYTPENCRWATVEEQSNNRSTNAYHVIDGERLTRIQISRRYNIPHSTLFSRLESGMSIEEAITPVNRCKKLNEVKVREIKQLIREGCPTGALANRYGVSPPTICDIKSGRTWNHVTID